MKSLLQRLVLMITAGLLAAGMSPELAHSQDLLSGLSEPGTAQYTKDYGRPGYPRVEIYLWGNGEHGIWTVEEGTDLLEFLSVAARGNFNESADTRTKNILRMYRRGQVNEDPVFKMRMEKIFSRQVEFPTLQNGDVLVVESIQRRRFFTFRNISRVTGTVASIASLIFLVTE